MLSSRASKLVYIDSTGQTNLAESPPLLARQLLVPAVNQTELQQLCMMDFRFSAIKIE